MVPREIPALSSLAPSLSRSPVAGASLCTQAVIGYGGGCGRRGLQSGSGNSQLTSPDGSGARGGRRARRGLDDRRAGLPAGRLPCAAGDVGVIVGTSAGSVLAAALRCHASFDEMIAWQRDQTSGDLSESVALAARDGPLPPMPRWRFGSTRLALATVTTPHRVPPWVGAKAWLPPGRGQHAALRSLVSALQLRHHQQASRGGPPPNWVGGQTWVAAMDYDAGQRVLFGQGSAPRATLPEAVVASCSIPGWYSRRSSVDAATSMGVPVRDLARCPSRHRHAGRLRTRAEG